MKYTRRLQNKPGIYKISNNINAKIYIGSSINVLNRTKAHIKLLKAQTHPNIILQRFVNKYGIESIKFTVIKYIFTEETETKESILQKLHEIENTYFKERNLFSITNKPLGFNLSMDANKFFLHRNHTNESKNKISIGHKGQIPWMAGKHHSKETKEKIRSNTVGKNKGNTHTEESKLKMSKSLKESNKLRILQNGGVDIRIGVKRTEEAKLKMSEAHKKLVGVLNPFYGKIHSEETKEKISIANTGKVRTKEVKEKFKKLNGGINNNMYGKHHSEETKLKMKIAWTKRKPQTEEHRKHISEALKRKPVTQERIDFMTLIRAKVPKMTEETKMKIGKANKGRIISEEHRMHISNANKGRVPWNKGLPFEMIRTK